MSESQLPRSSIFSRVCDPNQTLLLVICSHYLHRQGTLTDLSISNVLRDVPELTTWLEIYEFGESCWANVPKIAIVEADIPEKDVEWVSIVLAEVSGPRSSRPSLS